MLSIVMSLGSDGDTIASILPLTMVVAPSVQLAPEVRGVASTSTLLTDSPASSLSRSDVPSIS